jgi:hypothetical protein
MAFDIDVLITFAEKDNETQKNEQGWVSQFKKFLELMLFQVLGSKPNIILKSCCHTGGCADERICAIGQVPR